MPKYKYIVKKLCFIIYFWCADMDDWEFVKEEDLPLLGFELAKIIGLESVVKLMQEQRKEIYVPKRQNRLTEDHFLVRVIGKEKAVILLNYYGGCYIYLKTKQVLSKARARRIKAEWEGTAKSRGEIVNMTRRIARRENLSMTWVKKCVAA